MCYNCFQNVELGLADVSRHMKEFALKNKVMSSKGTRKQLIGIFHAEKKMVNTPLLRWYLRNGLCITKIYSLLQYNSHPIFKRFTDEVIAARQMASLDERHSLIGTIKYSLNNHFYHVILNYPNS